ncbi:MAG TPA: cation-translocating P-type ATPase [Clostridia bacterium]|nr:cation-translocating P-type ATPase [Clostridia bacterium]
MNLPVEHPGLSSQEARERLARYGRNELVPQKKTSLLMKMLRVIAEPMFLLLLAAAVIYFILGEARDGAIMLIFVVAVIGIETVQEWKTDKTLAALRDLSAPHVGVFRDGMETKIPSAELVPGDVMLLHEGVKIPADGLVLRCSDLRVDESSLTGESVGVWKLPAQADSIRPLPEENHAGENAVAPSHEIASGGWREDTCYAGTLVTQGTAAVLVEKTGRETEYGKIGSHVAAAPDRPTPLEKQTAKLVKTCAVIAVALFALVGIATWFNLGDHAPGARLIESVLSGITLAMAMIPEEFPVILTVFLSMGAWRLARKHSLVRRLPCVETLGAVSVLCVDKTGTITMNRMRVEEVWSASGSDEELVETMGLGCEVDAYDPMETAIIEYCDARGVDRGHLFGGTLVTEYAFTNERKMMGHVWEHDGELIVAVKGSPESVLALCGLTEREALRAREAADRFAAMGLRVIAVGIEKPATREDIPADIMGCSLRFLGLVGLADPPREGVKENIETCHRAGVRVVMITGDNGVTAASIAKAVGMKNCEAILTGAMIEGMDDAALREAVKHTAIFSRVVPEHKMRIVKALRDNGEVVAMTGDGVNDAIALKYADIGIAMGGRGSEVSREAADLILMDDNFATIVDTIRDGRRIYENIRKAMGYVFTIHIPIALSALIAPILGVAPGALLLLPLHVVLLELIIDPTCSVVLERQIAERNVMDRPPRDPQARLLTAGVLIKSVAQGLLIFAASFGAYLYMLRGDMSRADLARAMGLCVILFANVLLVHVNASERDPVYMTTLRLARDKIMWAVTLGTFALILAVLYTPLSSLLKLAPLSGLQLLAALGIGAASVLWYELVKAVIRKRNK